MLPIIVVDQVALFRRGVRIELERTGEWVVLESIDTAEIIELVQGLHPACAIIDGSLTTVDPFELCWSLRQQSAEIGILILDSSPNEERCFEFFRHGANAYVIYPKKLAISQKMCHAAKCFQRMGFLL